MQKIYFIESNVRCIIPVRYSENFQRATTMIEKIDIPNLGSFKDFDWDKSIRDSGNNIQKFKRLNIIYGRNYSGKTTISRIFRSLETREKPLNYTNPLYSIQDNNIKITQGDINSYNFDIRVYNRDFVTDNLNFLVDQTNGAIKTFAIVGEKNNEIEEKIKNIESELGSIGTKSGLRFSLDQERKILNEKKNSLTKSINNLDKKLRDYANTKIKTNRYYGISTYNIDKIKNDIKFIQNPEYRNLNSNEKELKLSLIKQDALPDISYKLEIKIDIEKFLAETRFLLSKIITPTKAIQELLNDNLLQIWVKEGIALHKNKRETCAFCRQNLPHDIWKVLGAHFSKESSDLDSSINECLNLIEITISEIPNFFTLPRDRFYNDNLDDFDKIKENLYLELNKYESDLKTLQSLLNQRKGNLFETVEVPKLICNQLEIEKYVSQINNLIIQNNNRTKNLEREKNVARADLRLTDIASFVDDINYNEEKNTISNNEKEYKIYEKGVSDKSDTIARLEEEIITLLGQQKDERKGAERVNTILNHFFGHDGIKLEAKDNTDNASVKFEITRDGKSAYNLSEGECSLISFCYFIAKLEEPNSSGKQLIIYIDDPISSLDGNHIFFMFSLIESVIAKPNISESGSNDYRYKQLFISTHNLDFLKYLKKLSAPNRNSGGIEYFLIERHGSHSDIKLMPTYLKEYITEFNYLFHQIYKCRNHNMGPEIYEPYYSFGNNMRKFLEVFLFFKYPHHDNKNDSLERIKKFFGEEDTTAITLINRLNNEFSHLECIPDRGFKPLEIPEICQVANFVLSRIKTSDPEQYNSLLKSIGENE